MVHCRVQNYLLFSFCTLACSSLSPCMFPFVPFKSFFYTLVCSFLYPCKFFFELFCANFYCFLSLLCFSPPCCTCCLPIIPFPFVSFSFPPNRTFSALWFFFPGLCRTFFFSQSYTFLLNVSRGFRIKYAKFKGHNKSLKRKLKRKKKKKKGKIYELNMGIELRAFWSRSGRRAIALPRHGTVNLCKKRFV